MDDFGVVDDSGTNDRDSIPLALDYVNANGGTSEKTYFLAPSLNRLKRCGFNLLSAFSRFFGKYSQKKGLGKYFRNYKGGF